MIKDYKNGDDFILENKEYLLTDKYLADFFFKDAKLMKEVNKKNYMIKVEKNGKRLLCLKLEPYCIILFGDKECEEELFDYIISNGLEMKEILSEETVGKESIKVLEKHGYKYVELTGMDFMEARDITEPTASNVIHATKEDFETICDYSIAFIKDCGLRDEIVREKIFDTIDDYRIIKEDGKIKAMAKINPASETDMRVSAVYTINECRGKGYARKVVNACKNEILEKGLIATLNVDKKNPISNHLYASLGFKKVFSQGIYGEE